MYKKSMLYLCQPCHYVIFVGCRPGSGSIHTLSGGRCQIFGELGDFIIVIFGVLSLRSCAERKMSLIARKLAEAQICFCPYVSIMLRTAGERDTNPQHD